MFPGLKRLVGNITLEVEDHQLHFEGLPADVIIGDIMRAVGTSKIAKHMFVDVAKSSFRLHEFFALDFVYLLDKLRQEKGTRANHRSLSKIKELLLTKTHLANTDTEVVPWLNRSKLDQFIFNPKDFQSTFFDVYETKKVQLGLNGYLLAAAAGSGKTYTSIALAEMSEADIVIVVAPNQALDRVWRMSLDQSSPECLFKKSPTWWVKGSSTEPIKDQKYIVFNYEYLSDIVEILGKWKNKKVFVILDESHNLNEIKSLRTDLFVKMCKSLGTDNVLWMSGTPIKALGSEAIPLIRSIDPMFTEECLEAFKKIFGVNSTRASEMLNNRLNGLMYVVPKSALKLPEPIISELKVKVHNGKQFTLSSISEAMKVFVSERTKYYNDRQAEDYALYFGFIKRYEDTVKTQQQKIALETYKKAVKTIRQFNGDARFVKDEMVYANGFEKNTIMPILSNEDKKVFRNVKSIYKYVSLKIQGECLGRVVGRARVEAHSAMAKHIDYVRLVESVEKKTVVFSSYIEVLEQAVKKCEESGLEVAKVYGPYTKNLSKTVDKFGSDENLNPLIATYDSLSTAVPLIMANNMLMIDAPFRDYRLQQTISRISRLGATTDTYVVMAVLDTDNEPNISTRGFDILKWSQESVAVITGVTSPFDLSGELETSTLVLEDNNPALSVEDEFLKIEEFYEDRLEYFPDKSNFLDW